MKNCKNCTHSAVRPDNEWYCRYDGFLKRIPFPVCFRGGPRKCECYEDCRVKSDFIYPQKRRMKNLNNKEGE